MNFLKPTKDLRVQQRIQDAFNLYRLVFRPVLFLLDAETAHHFVLLSARWLLKLPLIKSLVRVFYTFGVKPIPVYATRRLTFLNPIGLAAGFDKNGTLIPGIQELGFGFIEIGTVTCLPQLGNEKPRLFRLPEKRALVNKMGFNNDGADLVFKHLKHTKKYLKVPLGINLGKNKSVPNSQAFEDYLKLIDVFRPLADYFVINISSPNTPGLRDLQTFEFIKDLGAKIKKRTVEQPIFIKLSPDLSLTDLKTICTQCGPDKYFQGLILANTLPTDLGGLSGAPLKQASLRMLQAAREELDKSVPIISVGGIETLEDVIERLRLGATSVQIYSALVYEGPGLIGRLLRGLNSYMSRQGIEKIEDFYTKANYS
ncbi:MAG: quinone-dependent dihydroorotate dehydrogenase [Bacteriovoracia bacterium]